MQRSPPGPVITAAPFVDWMRAVGWMAQHVQTTSGAVVLERLDAPTDAISYFGADYETDIYQVGQYSRQGSPEPQQHYLGSLQNLAVWSRALTPAEVAAERLTPGVTSLDRVAWWSLTEGAGATAANLAGTTADADLLPVDSPPTWAADCPSP